MEKSTKVPATMQEKYNNLCKLTDGFCAKYLNDEYKILTHAAIAALCRKRPSPLLKGKENTWAAGIIHALGTVNFLFDKTQQPYCSASDIPHYFDIATSTSQNKSKEIRELLGMVPFCSDWMLPSRIESSPSVWLVQVNGFIVDVRTMSLEIQEAAYEKGLIPYIPKSKPAP